MVIRSLGPYVNPLMHTWAFSCARGPDDMHVGSAAQTHISRLTCVSRG